MFQINMERFSASMLTIRGKCYHSVEEELEEIINAKDLKGSTNSFMKSISLVSSKTFLVPFACVGVILILFRLSGFVVISHYTATYFELIGVGIDPMFVPILVGVVRLLSTIFLPFILRSITKKMVFIVMGFTSFVGMLIGNEGQSRE